MYDIKTIIASILRKMQQNIAQSKYFPIHTTKRVVLRFHKINARLRLAKNSKISLHNRLALRWENLRIFSQSQPRIYFVKSQYKTFRGVNWKILSCSEFCFILQRKEAMTALMPYMIL
jgi:hypothetical protein